MRTKYRVFHIIYDVNDDIFRYCVDITADSKQEAIAILKSIEKDFREIVYCEERMR